MPSITPFLWFDTQAEEAMSFYASIFKRSKVISVSRAQGKVMSVQFELEGQRFMALNAGPLYKFTEAIAFFVGCDTQQEIDELWGKLVADGGEPSRCGWLRTSSACRGESFRTHSVRCWATRIRRRQGGR